RSPQMAEDPAQALTDNGNFQVKRIESIGYSGLVHDAALRSPVAPLAADGCTRFMSNAQPGIDAGTASRIRTSGITLERSELSWRKSILIPYSSSSLRCR